MRLVDFLGVIRALKRIPRFDRIGYGVNFRVVESVAEHSLSTAMLAMVISDHLRRQGVEVDVEKCIKMALIHDVPEVMTFDVSKLT